MKSLEQRKLDAKNSGWEWKIDHPNDERALMDGCYPDIAAALRVKEFFSDLLRIPKPGGGTQPFVLLDWWYREVLGPLFGWKRADGRRRFDKGFITTAKKSAKSTVLSGLPIYMITADGEEEAEAYSTAVDRDQASIIYKKTSRMVKLSTDLSGVLKRIDSQKRIVHHASGSYYEAISSDADSAEGKNPHLLISDELHVWSDRQFFNALMYGDIAREQPLFLMITTAGEDLDSVGYEEYEFAKDLLNPATDFYSMSHFAFIAEARADRDWDDPEGWKEANPSIGQPGMPSEEKLQAKCDEAKQSPRKRREFTRYICNRWVGSVQDAWLDEDAWKDCYHDAIDLRGQSCCGGLDLSRTRDLTALCLAFPIDGRIHLRWWFWCPEERVRQLGEEWRVPLEDWVQKEFVFATPGAVVDYAYVRAAITGVVLDRTGVPCEYLHEDRLVARYDIRSIYFDRWNSGALVTDLGEYDGLRMVDLGQGFRDLSPPAKEFENHVLNRTIHHDGNPVMRWMVRHAVTDNDPAGNIKPSRKKSRHKIDGVVAAIMATCGALVMDVESRSFYDDHELEMM